MKRHNIILILALLGLFLGGCRYDFILPVETTPIDNGGQPISFATQVVPILESKCNSCHNAQAPLMTSSNAFSQLVPAYVNTSSPASSQFYINASSGTHYAKVSSSQAAIILQWITEGAKNN